MSSLIQKLCKRELINPPKWVRDATQYEAMVGSVMYGVSDDLSDVDVSGFCIPRRDMVFPHLRGEVQGFGRQLKRFDQYQQHHVDDPSNEKQYDITVYSIVRYFQLCMDNNPNMLDVLFAPENCILHITRVGTMVRESRRQFLHKGCWHKFKGYAFSQLHKAKGKNPEAGSKRAILRDRFGMDVKFLYHVVRLIGEVEQILEEGDLDLQRNKEHLKAIRRGEVPQDDIESWFMSKEKALEYLYQSSSLRHKPDEPAIKSLLLSCLEQHYGSLGDCVTDPNRAVQAIREVGAVLQKYGDVL